jgi:two-component sensor histidine kinase
LYGQIGQLSDNGARVPQGFDFKQQDSMGLLMIFMLGEQQLQGKVTFEAGQGVACQLCFRDDLYEPRV